MDRLPPWFYIHLRPLQGHPPGTPIEEMERRRYAEPTPSSYPVVGFHKEPDTGTTAGEVLLLFDDGVRVHPVRQDQTIRCGLLCSVCGDQRRKERDAQGAEQLRRGGSGSTGRPAGGFPT